MTRYFVSILCGIGFCLAPALVFSQEESPNETSEISSVSASVVSGPGALSLNPANISLPIYSQRSEFKLGGMRAGTHHGYLIEEFGDRAGHFPKDWMIINPDEPLTPAHQFDASLTGGYNYVHHDVLVAGFSQRRDSFGWGLSIRSRGLNSSYQSGDWYEEEPSAITDRRLSQRMLTYHEIGLGFARPLEMVTGWRSGLNTVILGFNPKFIIGGMYFDGEYHSQYTQMDDGEVQQNRYMNATSTGAMVDAVTRMSESGMNAADAYDTHFSDQSLFDPAGYGGGLDIGVTWVIALGNDAALAPGSNEPLMNNVRFSASVNDIGAIHYGDEFIQSEASDSTMISSAPNVSPYAFTGKPGEFHRYLEAHDEDHSVYQSLDHRDEALWVQLPTTVNLAASFHYNRFMIGADASYQLHDYNFFNRGWHTRIATESRLFRVIPIRSAIVFDPDFNPSFQIGAGLDFNYVDISLDTRLVIDSNEELRMREFATGTLSIRF